MLSACLNLLPVAYNVLSRPLAHFQDLIAQRGSNIGRDGEKDAAKLRVFTFALTPGHNLREIRSRILAHEHLLDACRQRSDSLLQYRKDAPTSRHVSITKLAAYNHLLLGPPYIVRLVRTIPFVTEQSALVCRRDQGGIAIQGCGFLGPSLLKPRDQSRVQCLQALEVIIGGRYESFAVDALRLLRLVVTRLQKTIDLSGRRKGSTATTPKTLRCVAFLIA